MHRPEELDSDKCPPEDVVKRLLKLYWFRKNNGKITSGKGILYPALRVLTDVGYPADSMKCSPSSAVKSMTNWVRRDFSKPKRFDIKWIFQHLKTLDWPPPCPNEDEFDGDSVISASDSESVTSSCYDSDFADPSELDGICLRLQSMSLTRNHYVYIFVAKFDIQEEGEHNFNSFVKSLFYVGQGTTGGKPDRFESHFTSAKRADEPISPLEKVMKEKKIFFAEILWDRLTKSEADYLEKKLITDAITRGKHTWGKHGNKHTCTARRMTADCLCNQQRGNTHDAILPDSPFLRKDLHSAFLKFLDLTENGHFNRLRSSFDSNTNQDTSNDTSTGHLSKQKIVNQTFSKCFVVTGNVVFDSNTNKKTPGAKRSAPLVLSNRNISLSPMQRYLPPKKKIFFVTGEKDDVYHTREGCCDADQETDDVTDKAPCEKCCPRKLNLNHEN